MTESQQYPAITYPDRCTDGTFCYVAMHPDLPGCATHADTATEARALLSGARKAYLKALAADGSPAPEPSDSLPSEIVWEVGAPTYNHQKLKIPA